MKKLVTVVPQLLEQKLATGDITNQLLKKLQELIFWLAHNVPRPVNLSGF
jgi:hypothetical protein